MVERFLLMKKRNAKVKAAAEAMKACAASEPAGTKG